MKRRIVLVLLLLGVLAVLVSVFGSAKEAANWPWNKLSFSSADDESIVSRMLLEVQADGTLTAYLLVRDVFWKDNNSSWQKQPLEKLAFTSYVQSPSGHFEDVIESLYWASDQTGWGIESPNWKWHNDVYKYAYYVSGETVNFSGKSFWRRKVMFIIQGIPLPQTGTVVCAQFLLRYKNPDGSFDYVWFNPGFLDHQDRDKYWVPDLLTPQGLVIRGKFDADKNFIKVPKTSP